MSGDKQECSLSVSSCTRIGVDSTRLELERCKDTLKTKCLVKTVRYKHALNILK